MTYLNSACENIEGVLCKHLEFVVVDNSKKPICLNTKIHKGDIHQLNGFVYIKRPERTEACISAGGFENKND